MIHVAIISIRKNIMFFCNNRREITRNLYLLFMEFFFTRKASSMNCKTLLQFYLVCGLRLRLAESVLLPKSCAVSDLNFLFFFVFFCARNHASCNLKGNVLLILQCQDKIVYVLPLLAKNSAFFQC